MSKIIITPIGTCRISTPLKRGATRFPIQLDYQRIYGFVHSTTEVIQQLRFRRGEISFPRELEPILFRPGVSCDDQLPERQPDMTIVEISSSKVYLVGDVAIQCNYLHQRFSDFFSRPARARAYFELARRGDPAALVEFLEQDPVYKLYGPEDRKILAGMSMRVQTFDEVLADMEQIAQEIGRDRLLFVTHVNVATPDGSLIASRDKLIRWVKSASAKLDIECFDPTQLMMEFGQERAMESGGLDSTHYTNAFSDAWFAKVQRDYIFARAIGAGVDAEDLEASAASMVSETIAATLQHYDFFEGSRQLFAALKAHPEDVSLQLLHGQVLSRIGDYDGAVKLLSSHVGSSEMTHETRQDLLRAQIETGDAEGALELASQMIGDEFENAEIYEIAGRAADALGRTDDAVRYRKLAFRRDPNSSAAAVSVLDHYKATGEAELYDAWLGEVMDAMDEHGDAAHASGLAEWAIARREDYALGRALAIVARRDVGLLPTLIEEAARGEMYSALPGVALMLSGSAGMPDRAARPLRSLAQEWAETADKLLADGRSREAHALAAAALAVQPNQAVARRVRRAVVDALWAEVQGAPDDAAVVALGDGAGDMVYERRSIALLYGRALAKVGQLGKAQAVAARLHAVAPDDVDARANYAHIAGLNGDFRTALELYGALAESNDEGAARYANRIQAFMGSAGPKGIRFLRNLTVERRFGEEVETYRLLQKYSLLTKEQSAAEGLRMLSAMRTYLRQLDEEEAAPREVLETLNLMLELAPDDARLLRRAGLEYMKAEEFEQATEYWRRLEVVSPDLKSASNNVQRCEIMAARQARRRRGGRVSVPLAA